MHVLIMQAPQATFSNAELEAQLPPFVTEEQQFKDMGKPCDMFV